MTSLNSQSGAQIGHVAIIMDGNGRWATQRSQPRSLGHVKGVQAMINTYRAAAQMGIQHLTLYTFSVANFGRPKDEVTNIMQLAAEFAKRQCEDMISCGIRLELIGDLDRLPSSTRASLENTIAATASQSRTLLSLAMAYGGQEDLLGAVRALAAQARDGALETDQIDLARLRQNMWTHQLPDVDLMIRTGGEQRLSDFLLIENAYSELYFDDVLWPDFTPQHLQRAIDWFKGRQRRFGGVTSVECAA